MGSEKDITKKTKKINAAERFEELSNQITTILKHIVEYRKLSKSFVASYLGVSETKLNKMLSGNYDFNIKHITKIGLLYGKMPVISVQDAEEKDDNPYNN